MKIKQLNRKLHKNLKYKKSDNIEFIKGLNVLDITASEAHKVYDNFPIVFTSNNLFIITKLKNSNLFLDDKDKLISSYLPKYIKNYPFILLKGENDKEYVCIDESSSDFTAGGKSLFNKNGTYSKTLKDIILDLEEYSIEKINTNALVELLVKHNLLIDANVKTKDNSAVLVDGFKIIDTKKLQKLPKKVLEDFSKKGITTFINLHIKSLENLNKLV